MIKELKGEKVIEKTVEKIKIVKDKIAKQLKRLFRGEVKEMKLDAVQFGDKVNCKRCNKEIENFIFVDNKIDTNKNGKYCIECYERVR